MAGSDTTWQFRHQQARMRARLTRDLSRVWPMLDFARLDATYPGWAFAVEEVVHRYEQDGLARSRDYLAAFYRDHGVAGTVPVIAPPSIPREQIDALLHSQAVASLKKAAAVAAPPSMAASRAFVSTSQSMVRVVRDQSREQVRLTALHDDRFGGWQRVGTGDTCAFCQMLIGRGATYSEMSVRFASHANCNCEVQPGYGGDARPVDEYRQSERRAKYSDEQLEADRIRVRDWLEVNNVG